MNNAGTGGTGGPTWEKAPADWWRVFEVNVLGAFLCARGVLPGMCERRTGRIVNVASNAAFFPVAPDWDARIDSAYQASKAALIRVTEALAAEARPFGVQVFAISPGMVKTTMTEEVFADIWDADGVWTPPSGPPSSSPSSAAGRSTSSRGATSTRPTTTGRRCRAVPPRCSRTTETRSACARRRHARRHDRADHPEERQEDPEDEHDPVALAQGRQAEDEQQDEVEDDAEGAQAVPHEMPPWSGPEASPRASRVGIVPTG